MVTTKFLRYFAASGVIVASAIIPTFPAHASAYPGANGRIVYSSNQTGNYELFTASATGANVRQITRTTTGAEGQAVWSPNGKKIAFTSNRDGNDEIYVANANGTKAVNITNSPDADAQPNWSPDGKRLVFVSFRNGGLQLWTMNADGTKAANLFAGGVQPSFSPDGTKIAFTNSDPGATASTDVYVISADGTGLTNISNDAGTNSSYASFSPDGTAIAFVSDRSGRDQIWTMSVDGDRPTMITATTGQNIEPAWSPDATRIVFRSTRSGESLLYTVKPSGKGVVKVSRGSAARGELPNWQPLPRR